MHTEQTYDYRLPGRPASAQAVVYEQDLDLDPRQGRSVRRALRASMVTLRPRQWVKNALVVAAAGAAGALHHDDVPVRVTLASVAFCLLASGIYAINDVHDAPEDRMHPRKRHRPVAAGDLDPRFAIGLGGVLMCAGLTLCALVRPALALVGLGYVALTISYTLVWRRVILLDIAAVAGGFVLRALAGGVAAHVGLSRYFVLVVTCGAVFVAAGKRRAELQRSDRGACDRRQVLHRYRESWLRATLFGSATMALLGYCVWAFELPSVNGVPWRPLTIAPMFAALIRYGMLIRGGEGEAPDELLFGDRLLLIAGICWLVLFALAVHAAG